MTQLMCQRVQLVRRPTFRGQWFFDKYERNKTNFMGFNVYNCLKLHGSALNIIKLRKSHFVSTRATIWLTLVFSFWLCSSLRLLRLSSSLSLYVVIIISPICDVLLLPFSFYYSPLLLSLSLSPLPTPSSVILIPLLDDSLIDIILIHKRYLIKRINLKYYQI